MKSLAASLLLFFSLQGSVDAQRQKHNPITWTFGSSALPVRTLYPGDRLTFSYTAPTHDVAIIPDNGAPTTGGNDTTGSVSGSTSGSVSGSGSASLPSLSGSGSASGSVSGSASGSADTGSDMDPCTMKDTALVLDTTGTFTWVAPLADMDKTYWFLCTKQDHCSNGHMKFQVLVKMPTHVIDQWDVNQNFENISVNVGDTLAFDYKDTDHDVQMFASEDAYNNCDFAGATSECGEEGPCTIKITSGMQGQTYFGCSKSDHCQTGNQKMALTVESGAETVTASLATVLLGSLALLWTNKRL